MKTELVMKAFARGRRSGHAPVARPAWGALGLAITAGLFVSACQREAEAPPAPPRQVRTVTVEPTRIASAASFRGHVEAQDRAALGFRVAGRVASRSVGLGDMLREGQIVATLDPENELNGLRSARAALSAAQGVLRQAENQYERQSHLLARGVTSRADFEAAEQSRIAARSQVEAATAQLAIAEELVGFTTLKADAPGVVTATGAEAGEVVQAGRMIVQTARDGGRDAVFEIPEELLRGANADHRIVVALEGDANVRTTGRVREVAPQADPVTRTFRVRVGLSDTGAAFRLGSAVTGSLEQAGKDVVSIPATALVGSGAEAGVWVVDPATRAVSRRKLEVLSADAASAVIGKGLQPGDIVVTAGANQLREGQKVRLIGVES